jgi:4-carboxymuconolactone decarboxylase
LKRKMRIAPIDIDHATEEQKEVLRPWRTPEGRIYNLFATFVKHPKLLRRWYPYGMHVMMKSTLSDRDREIVIMRIAYLNNADYEWGHHRMIANRIGLTDEDLARVIEGAEADGWNDLDRMLIRAVDEMKVSASLSDEVYDGLADHYSEKQVMDLVHTYGAYNLVSTCLNVFGVQLEDDVPGLEKFQ